MAQKGEALTETQQNLLNAQNSYISFMRQQDQVNSQLQIQTYTAHHKHATMKAIEEIPDVPLYRAVGKAYYSEPRSQIMDELKQDYEKAEQDVKILNNTKVYVDKKIKETEAKLTELLKQA